LSIPSPARVRARHRHPISPGRRTFAASGLRRPGTGSENRGRLFLLWLRSRVTASVTHDIAPHLFTRMEPGESVKRSSPSIMEASMADRETHSLIGSDRVEGTAVYGPDQKKIGSVERVMIDKMSGKVAYAVIGYGGFLGLGEDHYPTPWSNLKYDTELGGYLVNCTKDQLDKAPKYANEDDWEWSRENDKRIYEYYRATPFWAG
jgi:hypothetical protein